ncbi:cocaine- and amphetamine-regulated transcript 4 [Engraulis encrasicolus]|uniref:cocaine- and amphetamine-regulated transcript 4 n=1 Tax=Engraulis encrasicolus TaxID=184585 RepID=UPI002FD75A0A
MDSARVVMFISVCLSVLGTVCRGELSSPESRVSGQEEQFQMGFVARDLAEALEGLLEGDQDNHILEKKASIIPRCDVGERCAMKHGPRIGRLCDCMRGTACNTFFLRCY